MKRIVVVIVSLLAAVLITSFYLASCSGGGGGGDGDGDGSHPSSGTGADNVTIFWMHYGTGDGTGGGGGMSVQETSDHGFIVTGHESPSSPVQPDVYVLKTDAQGAVQWQKRFGGAGRDIGQSVRQTADGGYIVAGCRDCEFGAENPKNFYLLKLDSEGRMAWEQTVSGSSLDGAYGVCETPDGYAFVGSDEYQDAVLIKTDLTGTVLWQQSFSGAQFGWRVGFAVEQTADDGFIIAGDSAGPEMWLIKTDADGALLWDKSFGSGEAFSVKQTPDGGYILAGSTANHTFSAPASIIPGDAVVIRTDQDGNELWRKTFGGGEDDMARSVELTLDGGYIVAGKTLSYSPGPVDYNWSWQWEDVFLIKLDANGNSVWRQAKGHRPNISDGGSSVVAVSDGGYVVTGNSSAHPQVGSILLMKTDKNGNTVNLGDEDLTVTETGAAGIIGSGNAVEAAMAGVTALTVPREAGAMSLDILIAVANGSAICSSGTYSKTLNPEPVQEGSVLSIYFSDCLYGDESKLTFNGSFTLKVDSLSDPLSSGTYTVQTTVNPINITFTETDTSITSTATGGVRFFRQAAGGVYTEKAESITTPSAVALTFSETGGNISHENVIGPFALSDTVPPSGTGPFSFGSAGDTATVTAGTITGPLTVTVLEPVSGTAPAEPGSGRFRITAQDNSRVTITLTGGGGVSLAVDTNGDGVDDGTVPTTWDYLY